MAMYSALRHVWRSSLRLSGVYAASGTHTTCCKGTKQHLRFASTSAEKEEPPQSGETAQQTDAADGAEDATTTPTTPATPALPPISNEVLQDLLAKMQGDLPVEEMENPFAKEQKKCILCKYKVDLDYKNTRLLSQFVSPYTGRIYGRHITGLCIPMQRRVAHLIKRAQYFGFMPFMMKNPTYLMDPTLFDPFKSPRS